MKRILITGANSYVGMSVDAYMQKFDGQYEIDILDMLDPSWREANFAGYDVIFHVAGIAHSDSGKISKEKEELYYAVNTALTIEVAGKAKSEGVAQFIYMSSAIVYGESAKIGKSKMITAETEPCPANCYGDSKLQAEKGILPLSDMDFKVVCLRPPMIYGKGSRGNYPMLSKFARKMKIFPHVKNQRSMLYIENLCEFVRLVIENEEEGIFHPQNREYTNTSEMVKAIGGVYGKNVKLLKGFGWALRLLGAFTGLVNKAFGNFTYDFELSKYEKGNYQLVSLEESILKTEE